MNNTIIGEKIRHLFIFVLLIGATKNVTAQQSKDTLWKGNLASKIAATKKANGNVLVHTETDSVKLYAVYVKGKISEWYAINSIGEKIPVSYAKGIKCKICIVNKDDFTQACYYVDCASIPRPPSTNTQ